MIPLGFIHNFSSYEHLKKGVVSFPLYVSGSNPFAYNIKEPKYEIQEFQGPTGPLEILAPAGACSLCSKKFLLHLNFVSRMTHPTTF